MASAIHRLHVLGFGLLMTLVCFRSAAALPDTPDRKLATDTVFEVHVICSEERVGDVVQPGFLVGPNGVGITSYNAFHNAKSATARFFDQEATYKIVILHAEVSLDLALVKLESADPKSPDLKSHLALAPGDLKDGQPVWTLRASNSMDKAEAIAGLSKVQSQNVNRRADNPFDAPGWIYGNSNQDRLTSGCPMVDEQGRLVGINVWAWPGKESRPLGLTARVVDDLLIGYQAKVSRAKEKGEPAPTIQVNRAKQEFHDLKLTGSVFPRMDLPKKRDISKAKSIAHQLAADALCGSCEGEGKVPNTKAGHKNARSKVACETCKGTGLLSEDLLAKVGARTAREICSIPPGSDGYDDVLKNLALSAREISKSKRIAFSGRLNESAREFLDPKRIKRGDAIMLVGSLSRRPPNVAAWDKDIAVVRTPWNEKAQILAIAPDDGGKLDSNRSAIIVGIVAGYVSVGRDDPWIVLERVAAVPLESGPK